MRNLLKIFLISATLQISAQQEFMTMGCDPSNPLIDPYLLAHSIYADSLLLAWSNAKSPQGGIVGTAGEVRFSNGYSGTDYQDYGTCFILASQDGGYFNYVNRQMRVEAGVTANWHTSIARRDHDCAKLGTVNVLPEPPYSDKDAANACRTRRDAANDGKFRPRFPNVQELTFSGNLDLSPANGTVISPGHYRNLTVARGNTVYMEAGTYYFSGSILVELNANLIVRQKDGSFRTIIYSRDRFRLEAGSRGQNEGGKFYPEGFVTGTCTVPEAARGQILVIAFGDGITNNEENHFDNARAAIVFGSNSSVAVGTFIAPNGGAFFMCGSLLNGQIAAKVVNFAYHYNNNIAGVDCSSPCTDLNFFTYASFAPPSVTVSAPKTVFLEDTAWNNYPDRNPPTYNGYSWSPDKYKDRWDTIFIELTDPAEAITNLTYTINDGTARIGQIPVFDAGFVWDEMIKQNRNFIERAFVYDYSGTLTFNVGDKIKGIPIYIIDDGLYQTDSQGTFSVEVGGVSGGGYDPCNCSPDGNNGSGNNDGSFKSVFNFTISSDDPDIPPPAKLLSARYFDSNGDGIIDSITVDFDDDPLLTDANFVVIGEHGQLSIIGEARHDGNNKNRIILSVSGSPQDVTDGDIFITANLKNESVGIFVPQYVQATDGAAPVIVSASIVKSLVPGGSDVLTVRFSESTKEVVVAGNNIPFLFVHNGSGAYFDDFVTYNSVTRVEHNIFSFVIDDAFSGMISGGDSITINTFSQFKIEDPGGVFQDKHPNKRVEIVLSTVSRILSATYSEDDGVKDGYIDRIRFEFGAVINETLARKVAEKISLPESRAFSRGSVTLTESGTGFYLAVTEEKRYSEDGLPLPRTEIDINGDAISLSEKVTEGDLTVEAGDIPVRDGVAPVILRAVYDYVDSANVSLRIFFSEPTDIRAVSNPYKFYQAGEIYDMVLEHPASSFDGGREWIYKVNGNTASNLVTGDSIWIEFGGTVYDGSDNEQEKTVRAPMTLARNYPVDITLHIHPQPARIGRDSVRVVLDIKGAVSKTEQQKAQVLIVDQLGNVVMDSRKMEFGAISGGLRAEVVWDGKNRAKRTVGAGIYLAIVEVEIEFDDRPNKEVRVYRRPVAVAVRR